MANAVSEFMGSLPRIALHAEREKLQKRLEVINAEIGYDEEVYLTDEEAQKLADAMHASFSENPFQYSAATVVSVLLDACPSGARPYLKYGTDFRTAYKEASMSDRDWVINTLNGDGELDFSLEEDALRGQEVMDALKVKARRMSKESLKERLMELDVSVLAEFEPGR